MQKIGIAEEQQRIYIVMLGIKLVEKLLIILLKIYKELLEVIYKENKDKSNLKCIKKIFKNKKVLQVRQQFKKILEDFW